MFRAWEEEENEASKGFGSSSRAGLFGLGGGRRGLSVLSFARMSGWELWWRDSGDGTGIVSRKSLELNRESE